MNKQTSKINISCEYLYEAMAYNKFAKALAMALVIKNKVTSSTVVDYTINKLCEIAKCNYRPGKSHFETMREYGIVRETKVKNRKDITFLTLKDKKPEKNVSMENLGIKTLKDAENHVYMLCFKMIIETKHWVKRQLFTLHNFNQKDTHKTAKRMCRHYGLNRHENDQYIDYGISITTIAKKLGIGREKAQRIVNMAVENHIVIKIKRIVKVTPDNYKDVCKYIGEEKKQKNTFVSKRCNVYKVHANIYIVPEYNNAETETTTKKILAEIRQNIPENVQIGGEKPKIGGENPQNGRENITKSA